MTAENGTNQAIERALAVLGAFSTKNPVLRVADVARICGIGTSTASRVLATLAAEGMTQRDDNGQYQLGYRMISLGGIALNNSSVYRRSRNVAYGLSCELGAGVNVAELQDGHVFYLLNFDGKYAPRDSTLIGQYYPVHATGLGRCLLCELDVDERDRLLGPAPLPAYTAFTIVDRDQLELELARVRERGYAIEREEIGLTRACVAAPIRDKTGKVVAAISISGPLSLLRLEERTSELAQVVIEAADRISTSLGAYVVPQFSRDRGVVPQPAHRAVD